nr:immunoglobulin heavy chain junction region [Mus musculus]
CARSSGKDDYW